MTDAIHDNLEDLRVQAWDSSVLLSFLTRQVPERVEVVGRLLDFFRQRRLRVIVSTFAQAEVRSYRGSTSQYAAEDVEIVREFFRSDELEIWTLTPFIAEAAADLGNVHPELAPADCVHIVTAIEAGAPVLFTYDGAGKRRRVESMLAMDRQVGDPPLRILMPFDPWPVLWTSGEPPDDAGQQPLDDSDSISAELPREP